MTWSTSFRKLLVAGVILIGLFWSTRLYNLTAIPIFTDEAIYIRWAQIGSRDANWRFISLTDGKQPLFTWGAMVMLRAVSDPLYAGRFVSVLSGFFTFIGLWVLSYELFRNKRLSALSGLLYIFSPFSLMYDRLALYDSLVAAFSVWCLFLAILLVRKIRLDIGLLLGMVLGLGILNKSSGFLNLYLLPLTLLLFDWRNSQRVKRFILWVCLVGIVTIISLCMYNILRLSPYFHMIYLKNSVFVYPIGELLSRYVRDVTGNLQGLFDWVTTYMTKPIFILSLIPIVIDKHRTLEKALLYGWWVLPFFALAVFGKILYPRFILFMTMPLILLASYSFDWLIGKIGQTFFGICILSLLFFPSIRASYYILTDPIYAPIPLTDRGQLLDNWPSGWGIKQVNYFLFEQSKKSAISIYTEGTFGLLPYAVEIDLVDKPGVYIQGLWPVSGAMPPKMIADALKHPTFLILNFSQKPPGGWTLDLLAEYPKGRNPDSKLRLYRVVSSQKVYK